MSKTIQLPNLEMLMIESFERKNDKSIKLQLTNGETYVIVIDEYSHDEPVLEVVKEK